MLITLSYAEAANNLQIILTIRLTPLKMDELLWFDKIIKIYQPLLKKQTGRFLPPVPTILITGLINFRHTVIVHLLMLSYSRVRQLI